MILKTNHFDDSLFNDSLFDAHRMSTTNGTLNYMGVLEEFTDKYTCPLTFVGEKEEKRLSHPLFTLIKAENILLNPKFVHPVEHHQSYDIEKDMFSRKTVYQVSNTKITIVSERFVDQNDHIIYSKYQFKTNRSISIDLYHGINDNFEDLDIESEKIESELSNITITAHDQRFNTTLKYNKDFKHKIHPSKDKTVEHYKIRTEKNRFYTIIKYVGVGDAIELLNSKIYKGYEEIKKNHLLAQKKSLDRYKIDVVSNKDAQAMIDFSMRHLYKHPSYIPKSNMAPLTYYFMIFSYLHHRPERARKLLVHEIEKLAQSKEIASDNGYRGALYLTNPDNYEEGNQHILNGAMIIYMLNYYVEFTQDEKIIDKHCLQMLVDICDFYCDYASFNKDFGHYAFQNVANIDGSIKHIDYHILTHFLVKHAVTVTKKYIRRYKFKVSKDLKHKIDDLYQNIYIPLPNVDDLILPYRDFLKDMEDKRLVLNDKKIDISVDQLLIFMLFENKYNGKIIRRNIDFYHKNLVNDLTNRWIYSLIPHSEISTRQVNYFYEVASVQENSLLVGEDGYDLGGCGYIYYMLVHVFAGLRKNEQFFSVNSNIPSDIRRLEFWIRFKEKIADIKIKRNSASFVWQQEE